MEDEEHLNRLTPRERDVYEVWREHPDWSNAQIGRGWTAGSRRWSLGALMQVINPA